jgi:hypothetical protein
MKMKPRNKAALFLNSRWTAYAAAGAATAFGAATAEAEIHYSGRVDVLLDPDPASSTMLPLSNGVSIGLFNGEAATHEYNGAAFQVLGAGISHGFRATNSEVNVERLRPGLLVSQGVFHQTTSFGGGNIRSIYNPEWDGGGQGFIGFKFNTGAGTQYGWVRIKITPADAVRMIVFEYAWG